MLDLNNRRKSPLGLNLSLIQRDFFVFGCNAKSSVLSVTDRADSYVAAYAENCMMKLCRVMRTGHGKYM
jgi:hypothetical protein